MVERGRDPQTYAIIGAAMEVHRQLRHGFLEGVYQEAFELELTEMGIPHDREVPITVEYKGTTLACAYKADFICYGEVLVELKAVSALSGADEAQVINYLKATGSGPALLLNFGAPRLEYKRLVFSHGPRNGEKREQAGTQQKPSDRRTP
jgi:GxxExxY protein